MNTDSTAQESPRPALAEVLTAALITLWIAALHLVWLILEKEVPLDTIRGFFGAALQASGGWMEMVWLVLFAGGLVAAFFEGPRRRRWPVIYAGAVLALGAALYLGLLVALKLKPHSWCFLVLMAPSALMLDGVFGGLEARVLRTGRMVLSLVLVLASIPACYSGVNLRQSNVDVVAARLKADAEAGDLIVISPWYLGVALQRYYDAGKWTTVPPMTDLRIHRYDLLKQAMMSGDPMAPVLAQARTALQSGHQVWLVGVFHKSAQNEKPPVLPRYREDMRQAESDYCKSWDAQLINLLMHHGLEVRPAPTPAPEGQRVNTVEDVPILVVRGWRE